MAKSECKCLNYSCESINIKTEVKGEDNSLLDVYLISSTSRFRFIKEDGVICGGGVVDDGDIKTCLSRGHYEPILKNKGTEKKKEEILPAITRKEKRKNKKQKRIAQRQKCRQSISL